MDARSTETIVPVRQTQEQLKGIEPLPPVTTSKEQEIQIQGKTSQLLLNPLELSDDDKNDTTDYFEDDLQELNKDSILSRKKRISDASSHSNYADMINELEKHVDELAISQDQISTLHLPREVTNKLKKDRNFLYKPKVAEEEEFESDVTSDYSDDDEEEDQLSEEQESITSSDKSGQKENDPEKRWKDFDWNSTIDLTTMKSQSLRNSYRNSGSFSRNSLNATLKNSSLQQPSRLNYNNINVQQWKKENQIKDLRNYNSRRVYNYRNLYPGEVVSADIRSDSSVDVTGGILINGSGVKSNRLELNKIKESKLSLGEANDIFSISSHKSRFDQEIEGSIENSLLIGDALPDKMLVRIKKLEFDPPRTPNSKAKSSMRLIIHSVTHQTKPNSSFQEQIQKMFLFPFDYHSFVFDTLKIDLYEHASFLYAKKKLGRAIIRLNTLKDTILKQKDFEGTFPLELSGEPNSHKVGIIDIAIKFHFPNDPPLPPLKTPKPLVTRSKTAPALLSSSSIKDKNKQILPPAVTNTRGNVDQEVSTDIEGADEGEFSNIVTHPETSPLGILDRVLNQETRDAIKEITVLYHAFFDHGWRLSKLEFLKAYMLLEKYYSQKPNPVTGSLCQNLKRIQTAQKYLKYSMASYGSFLFNWFGYGYNMHLNAIRINSDRKAVQEFFSLGKEDIICWEYGQKAVSVPNYMVIHDPETNSIIISIRGTMNVTDVITDALAHYEPWNGGFVHRGVLRSAEYLVNHSLKDIREAVKRFNSKAIQVIGHSLGASISSIVTLILREKCKDLIKQGINIHGWNFATAPCCSLDIACKKETLNCIDNYINENDVIPRLSYGNLMDLKELIKFAASELKNENYRKLSSKDKLAKILTSIDDYRTALKSNSSAQKLYIPGTIYYLYKGFHRSHIKSSIAFYTKDIVCERSRPDLFTDISLRKNWLFHHFPDRYDKKFKGVIKFLSRKLNEKDDGDKVGNKLLKWKRVAEADVVNDEGGRMGKWMSRSGHM